IVTRCYEKYKWAAHPAARGAARPSRYSPFRPAAGARAAGFRNGRRSPAAVVIHELDVVSGGIEHEGAVVARVVDLAFAGCAVVSVPGVDCRAMERIDRRIVGHREGDVRVLRHRPGDHGERAAGGRKLRAIRRIARKTEAGMARDELVEPLRRSDVRDANPQMVDVAAVRAHVVVVNGLGAVPVGVEQESAVVALAVLRTRTGSSVVAVAGVRSDAPELVDVRTRRRGECDV